MNVLKPGIAIYNRLGFFQKFLLIGLITLVTVSISVSQILRSEYQILEQGKEKLHSTNFIEPIRILFVNIAQTRGMTNSFLNGNTSVESKIMARRDVVNEAFKKLVAVESDYGNALNLKKGPELQTRWNEINETAFSNPAPVTFGLYTELIASVLDYLDTVRRNGQLAVEPDPSNAYIISVLMTTIPNQVELLGRLRGKGSGMIAGNDYSSNSLLLASKFADPERIKLVSKDIDYVVQLQPHLAERLQGVFNKALANLQQYLDLTKKDILETQQPSLTATEYFDLGTETISGLLDLYDVLLPLLQERFQERINETRSMFINQIMLNSFLMLVIFYSFSAIYSAINRAVNDVKRVSGSITDGSLDARVTDCGRDEVGTLASLVNEIGRGFAKAFYGVIQSSNHVSDTADRVARISKDLAASMQLNRDEMNVASSALTEMSASISEIAKNTEMASENAEQCLEAAKNGSDIIVATTSSVKELSNLIQHSVESTESLKVSSDNVAGILVVIRGIAEQTNLLALNAAIEAARAGEQGRGFAVVADEVRSLAQRTQDSTAEIDQLITELQNGIDNVSKDMENSRQYTDKTVELANQSGDKIDQIISVVNQIVDINSQIASTSHEQSLVSNEVADGLTRISDQTNVSYDHSEDLSGEATQLSAMSSELNIITKRFEFNQQQLDMEAKSKHNIQWPKEHLLDISEVDRQHQTIVRMTNEVIELIMNKRTREVVSRAIDGLHSYTSTHFSWEEEFISRNNLPGLSEHKKQHEGLLVSLKVIAEQYDQDQDVKSAEAGVRKLVAWLENHVSTTDVEYAHAYNALEENKKH